MTVLTVVLASLLLAGSAIALLSKLFFVAPTRVGFLVMFANIFYETMFKKFLITRFPLDLIALFLLTGGWWYLGGPLTACIFTVLFAALWGYSLHEDIGLRNCSPGEQDKRFIGKIPMPHPRLIAIIQGPVLDRSTGYDLGDWPIGHEEQFEILVLNPTILPPQCKLSLRIDGERPELEVKCEFGEEQEAPDPGEVLRVCFRLAARVKTASPIQMKLTVSLGSYVIEAPIVLRSIFAIDSHPIRKAQIKRWKRGARGGFAWRGDMDLYDPATFQSVEGLRPVLELSARYRIASTMFLSGRLCLDKEEHRKFCDKLRVDRRTEGIDGFIEFMREEVDLGHEIDFPYHGSRRFALEVGNHMYLHYGTHAAMAEGNNWQSHVQMGAGRYSWQSEGDCSSYAEQRDNAIMNKKVIEEKLGYTIRSWGVPGREYDDDTPRAVEASGMLVGSDTNASAFTNVLRLPPPHHPRGCAQLVELTKKYPGDPDNAFKIAMLKYWMGRAHRRGQVFIYMTHHHALRYQGISCLNLTDTVLRHTLEHYRGDFHVSTIYGLGRYWETVLCPEHRWVEVSVRGGSVLEISNRGGEALEGIPVDIEFAGGKGCVVLFDVDKQSNVDRQLGSG